MHKKHAGNEVTHINKQKFLTELSKFLTFLTDEERDKVLEKFEGLFDQNGNEEEILANMESPLKITVELSRAFSKGGLNEVLLFCEELFGGNWKPAEDVEAVKEEVIQAIDGDAFKAVDIITENTPVSVEEEEAPAVQNPLEDDGLIAVFEQDIKEKEEAAEAVEKEEMDPLSDEEVTSEEYTLEPQKEDADEEVAEEVAEALEDVAVVDAAEKLEQGTEAENTSEISAEEEVMDALEKKFSDEDKDDIVREVAEDLEPDDAEEISAQPQDGTELWHEEKETRYKARIWALIPYAIIAIPLGLIGVIVCAAITGAILAVAAALVGAVVMGASLAIQSGMSVLADIIMTIGATLIALGLSLLVIWLAVWFAVNTIGGIVGGLYRLGRKWCYKEVEVA